MKFAKFARQATAQPNVSDKRVQLVPSMRFVKSLVKQLYGRLVKRRMQEFNIENRAHKLLDRDKLPPAPRHFTEEQALQKFLAGESRSHRRSRL